MRILLVGSKSYRENIINRIVKDNLADIANVICFEDTEQVKSFIQRSLIQEKNSGQCKRHLDLVIVDDVFERNKYQKNLCLWLRDHKGAYSGENFRISSIPIILCEYKTSESSFSRDSYDAIIPFSENEKDDRLVKTSNKCVKDWREKLPRDLDILKIKTANIMTFGDNYAAFFPGYDVIANDFSNWFSRTEILSESFIKSPRNLDYDWLSSSKALCIEQSYTEYEKILKDLYKFNGKAFERQVLHKLYNDYPDILLRDIYEKQIYDKRYYISSTSNYHIPDYILVSPFPKFIKSSISEIKRHDIFFEYDPKRHDDLTKYVQKALYQASHYEDDFNDRRNLRKIGFSNYTFQMDLLIGLDDRLTERVTRTFRKHYSTINVITHDHRKREVERYYERAKRLNISDVFC